MKDEDPDKYLDPEYNPFIPKGEPARKRSPEPDGRAPFERTDLSPENVLERINRKYAGMDTAELKDGRWLQRSADGTWSMAGTPIDQLGPEVLAGLDKVL